MHAGDEEKQLCALKVLFYPKKTENFICIYVYEEYPVSQFTLLLSYTINAGCYPMEAASQATPSHNIPRIAAFKGTEMRQYFIFVEQSVLCEALDIQSALCGLLHFVFNLEYDKNAKHLSLFFQDVILGLPDTNKQGASCYYYF